MQVSHLFARSQRLKALPANAEPFWPFPPFPLASWAIHLPPRRPGIPADSLTGANRRLMGILALVFRRGKPFPIRASCTWGAFPKGLLGVEGQGGVKVTHLFAHIVY